MHYSRCVRRTANKTSQGPPKTTEKEAGSQTKEETIVIYFVEGNMFDNLKAKCFVNPVNCMGVMGKGLALQFKNIFPENYERYQNDCAYDMLEIGRVTMYQEEVNGRLLRVFNFPTKKHWRDPSQLTYIDRGLKSLVGRMNQLGIGPHGICIPKLGCGLGGLNWNEVRPMITIAMNGLTYRDSWDIFIYGEKD